MCHWFNVKSNQKLLREAYDYNNFNKSRLFQFWVSVVGYFAMGFTWEQVNGDADGTYNATFVSPETFVLVSKALGVVSCVVAFLAFIKPKLLN